MLMQNQNRLKILDLCFVRVGLHLLFDADKPKDGAWIKDAFLIVQFEVTLQSLCVCLFILFSKKIKQVIATLLSGFASGVLVLRHCYQMMQNLTTFFDSLHTKQSKNYYTHLMFSYKEKTRNTTESSWAKVKAVYNEVHKMCRKWQVYQFQCNKSQQSKQIATRQSPKKMQKHQIHQTDVSDLTEKQIFVQNHVYGRNRIWYEKFWLH